MPDKTYAGTSQDKQELIDLYLGMMFCKMDWKQREPFLQEDELARCRDIVAAHMTFE